jgi:exosortase
MKFSSRNIFFLLFSLVVLAAMAGPIRALIRYAMDTENTHASQIVLIPFISATLIYLNREKIFENVHYAALPALLPMIAGICVFIAGKTVGLHFEKEGDQLALMASSLVVFWVGGFLLFYGTRAFKAALFPLLFLIFCIPIPDFILDRTIAALQLWSANMAYVLIRISGTPVHRLSTMIFQMPGLSIEVAPQCSGIRSGISILISGLLAGHLFLRTYWRRVLLVLIAVPVLIFKNAVRIGTLSYLAVHFDKKWLTDSDLHRDGGILFFVLGLILLYPVLAMLTRSESKQRKAPDKSDKDDRSIEAREVPLLTAEERPSIPFHER